MLLLHVKLKRPVAAVAPDPACFDATEGCWQVADVLGIDPDHPRLKLISEPQGACQIIGPDVARQPVRNVIGDLQRLFFC